jgi:uroporphyrinogen-III synthase
MRVLLTRPEAQSRPLAEVLAARGIDALVDPLLETVPVQGARVDLDGAQAVLATSANGVRALAAATTRRDVPLLAVGPATAEAARAEGFTRVETAGGDVVALASLAAAILDPARGRLVHVAGTAVAGDLKGTLEGGGFTVERAVLYDARPARALAEATVAALRAGRIDGVLLFSPRTAKTFVGLVETAGLGATCRNLTAFCLSPAVADALRGLALGHVRVAQRPETDALLDLLLSEATPMTDRQPDAPGGKPGSATPAVPPVKPAAEFKPADKGTAKPVEAKPAEAKAAEPPKPAPAKPGAKAPLPKTPSRRWPLVVAAILVVLLVAAGSYVWRERPDLLARLGVDTSSGGAADTAAAAPDRVDVLTNRVRALEAALDGVSQKTDSIGDAATQIGVLTEQDAAIEKRLGDLEARLQALEQRAPDAGKPAGASPDELAALAKRVEGLEARASVANADQAAIAAVRTELDARISRQDDRLSTLENSARGAAVDARDTATVFALGRLRTALDGAAPYRGALNALDTLVKGGPLSTDQPVRKALDELGGRADKGVPTFADLRGRFEGAARDILAANRRPPEDAGWLDRLGSGMRSLVTVRRTGDVPGADAEALVARAERRLEAGDLPQAIAELAGLEGEAAKAATPWLEDARARLAADGALGALESRIASELGTVASAPGADTSPAGGANPVGTP